MQSAFPQKWKIAKIIPIPKSSKEYRPIAILPYLSKAFEIIMYKQMNIYFESNSLLTNRQSGFRSKRSCVTAVLDVSESIRVNIDENRPSFLVLLDCTKAFDSIDHFTLLQKLKYWYGFSSPAVKLVSSYLSERFQRVCSGNSFSDPLPVNKGVPQGSVLGPFLFSIYMNDFPLILQSCCTHMYADDIQLYLSFDKSDINRCAAILNDELRNVENWATQNKLKINPNKSKCIIVYKRPLNLDNYPVISINGCAIEYVSKARNLGVLFNNTLSWNDHINVAAGKVNGMLRILWQTQYFTPIKIRLLIAKAYLVPILLFGCEIFANADCIHKRKLQVAYNNIARYVFNLNRRDHVSDYAYLINNISFDNLLNLKVLLLLHKIIFTHEPIYLFERFRFTRSERNNNIIPLKRSSLMSERQFFIHAPRLWNTLEMNLQKITTQSKFKKNLISHFNK